MLLSFALLGFDEEPISDAKAGPPALIRGIVIVGMPPSPITLASTGEASLEADPSFEVEAPLDGEAPLAVDESAAPDD